MYESRLPGTVVGVAGAEAFLVSALAGEEGRGPAFFGVATSLVRSVCGLMSGPPPPRVSPAFPEQTGQAPGPCPPRTFSAMAICWSLVARSARGA